MSSNKFLSSLPFVLRWEGGFVDHPNDPGGRTNKGITQKVYDQYRLRRGEPAQDVKSIADREVNDIYESGYWMAAQCERLDLPLHLVQFDTAVNMGVTRAVRFLQQAVGCGVDGDFGPGTAKAVEGCDQGTAVVRYCEIRESFYRRLAEKDPKLAVFLKGWLNRLNSLRREAGIPGFESTGSEGFGDADYIMKIPDVGEDARFDL
jgi:lysozyme family protein